MKIARFSKLSAHLDQMGVLCRIQMTNWRWAWSSMVPRRQIRDQPASFYERTEEIVQTTKGQALVMVYNAERAQNMAGG
ncbi:hypothetical protein [Lentzea flaviverrucosa]|uniref:Uncharacterized protein n=1 Tax=Lentzea flaviverrucosa TaxID=200379 RepID=A0A1H9WTY8_9PSEU|nr:hypothetical protein [Lentzea flaviverrucosa]RDI23084.1 hypothetical protein DFR72_111215 [Lentzea flaviverrucosa]SES37147.1 hypothetical protein SAMN05216195_112209 [Lentzea flaviverrucosa]